MKKNVVLVLFCLSLGIAACGKDGGSSSGGSSSGGSSSGGSSSGGSSSGGSSSDTVVGPCTLTGNIRSFQVNCDRTIQNFTVGFMTAGTRLRNSGTINGTRYNTDITNNGTSLVGSEGVANSLDITINFADSSTASVTLRSN